MKQTWNLAFCLFLTATLFVPKIAWGAEDEPTDAPPAGSGIDGTWRWTFTMPDGSTSPVKLVLETEEGHLTGTTSFRTGTEATITNAVLNGTQLQFQVLRHRDDRDIVTTYSGVWNRNQIVGTVQSNWAGENQSYPWTAIRPHEGVDGLWKWTVSIRARKFEARVKLEQDGELLTGTVPGLSRGGRRIHISNGSIKNGELYFEIARGSAETKVVTIYRGKQAGDTIKGTMETIAGDKKSEAAWLAHRND